MCDDSVWSSGCKWLLLGPEVVALALLSTCEAARGRPLKNEAPKPSTVDRSGGLSLATNPTSIMKCTLGYLVVAGIVLVFVVVRVEVVGFH